jgi:hypothetical protein
MNETCETTLVFYEIAYRVHNITGIMIPFEVITDTHIHLCLYL